MQQPAPIVRPAQYVTTTAAPVTTAGVPVAGQPKVITKPAQYVTAAPQYVTAPAAASAAATMAKPMTTISTSSAPGTIIAPAQYITAPAMSAASSAAPRVIYQAPSTTVGGTTVMQGASASAPTTVIRQAPGVTAGTSLSGSVVRMAPSTTTTMPTVIRAAQPQAAGATTRPHTLAGPSYTQGAYEQKHQDDPQLQNLKELRKTSGLKHVPVNDGLSMLKAGSVEGKLSREQFVEAYTELLKSQNIEVAPDESVKNAVFDLFDRDDNNVVDMMELICGISLLCAGSEDDKIHAVFNVFDENGDGFITLDEMFKFLSSVFKVVLTPNVMGVMNSMGVNVESPDDLASVTALECFKTADLNNDGKLSVTEFKNWFYAPRNDPSFLFSPVRKLLQ